MTSQEPEDGVTKDEEAGEFERSATLERALLELPEGLEVPDHLLDRFRTSVHISLLPAYRQEMLFGKSAGTFFTYLVLASGTGITNDQGSATIKLSDLLECISELRPMHRGLHPSESPSRDADRVPGAPTMIGTPVTVVTGTGDAPATFATVNQGVAATEPLQNFVLTAWEAPVPERRFAATSVLIKSFAPDGTSSPRAPFGWHLTVEVLFRFFIGG